MSDEKKTIPMEFIGKYKPERDLPFQLTSTSPSGIHAVGASIVGAFATMQRIAQRRDDESSVTANKVNLRSEQLQRIHEATDLAYKYAQIDGAHHKTWVIDQMVRALLGNTLYLEWVKEYEGKRDADGNPTYEWDEGIAP